MNAALAAALSRALAAEVTALRPISGGDINDAYRARLRDGRELFVKTHARALPGLFSCEARGLRWLAEARALRIPEVIAVSDEPPAFLALELITAGSSAGGAKHDEQLGRGLAALHRSGAKSFGLDHDNYLATLPQSNAETATWPEFYATRRLEPLLRRAADAGQIGASLQASFARLFARIGELCGPAEPPARLHGDLWGGNAVRDERGEPVLIDPAVYGGHREVDLAMMQLFGGFGARCFGAYDEAYPRAKGHEERVALYQLYPLLAHVNLFGASYVAGVERAVSRYV